MQLTSIPLAMLALSLSLILWCLGEGQRLGSSVNVCPSQWISRVNCLVFLAYLLWGTGNSDA